jgi:hypothetical protein
MDMWRPFRNALEHNALQARIVFDTERAAAHSVSYGESCEMCRAATVPPEWFVKTEGSGFVLAPDHSRLERPGDEAADFDA